MSIELEILMYNLLLFNNETGIYKILKTLFVTNQVNLKWEKYDVIFAVLGAGGGTMSFS